MDSAIVRRPGAAYYAQFICDDWDVQSPPRAIRDVLEELVLAKEACSPTEAAERASELAPHVRRRLEQVERDMQARNEPVPFAFNPSTADFLQGWSYPQPGDPPPVARLRRQRAAMKGVGAFFDHLSSREFEVLCCRFLECMGATGIRTTPTSRDEGIDFYGRVLASDITGLPAGFPGFLSRIGFWLVGQAKHYRSSQVGTPDLRDISGAIALARGKAYGRASDRYPDLELRACDPVLALFITTGRISSDAQRLGERSGIVVVSGAALSAYVCETVSPSTDSAEIEEHLRTWLAPA